MDLVLDGIVKRVGPQVWLHGMDMALHPGAVTVLLGATQAGKTSLMRIMAGLDVPSEGRVRVDGVDVTGMPVRERNVAMVYQQFINYPSLTVADNIAFPLREHTRLPESTIRDLVTLKLHAVGLRGAARLMPGELSGGMARRAALARAIALEPDLIMFDEPFVGQDPITMGVLVKLISELNSALGVTCIVVSHDVPEVLSIADYAYIVADKKIVAHGSAQALQENCDPRVRQFLDGIADGPVPFRYPAGDYRDDLLGIGS